MLRNLRLFHALGHAVELKYRPEIDGLRTIAVGAVILYHAEIVFRGQHIVQGGFLGVDVFFVISGFLITTLIHDEYLETGRFSFLKFYERRARRLLPALFTVILVSIPFAWYLLLPSQLIDYAKSIAASVFFISNFYWDQTLLLYDAEPALLKPFVHTWSLAVEEQYYLVAPLLLLGLYRFVGKKILLWLGLITLGSLVLAEATNDTGSFAFFVLPTRLWELMIGAILAHVIAHKQELGLPQWARSGVMAVSLLALLASMLLVPYGNAHPGLVTAIPVLATALLIWFATPRDWITRLLASRLFVGFGLISYSLYLWHYPIFAFGRHLQENPNLTSKAIWIGLTVVLSVASYFLIEKPFRNRQRISLRSVTVTFVALAVLVTGISTALVAGNGFKDRFSDLVLIYGENEFDNQVLKDQSWEILDAVEQEGFYHDPDKTRVVFVGNSHSRDLWNAFYLNRELYPDLEFGRFGIQINAIDADVAKFERLMASQAMRQADIVVITSRYHPPRDLVALPKLISAFEAAGKKVIVVSNNEHFRGGGNGATLFDRLLRNGVADMQEINETFYERRDLGIHNMNLKLSEIAETAGVPFVYRQAIVCSDESESCYGATTDGLKTYSDRSHWTLEGARFFGQLMHETCWIEFTDECR